MQGDVVVESWTGQKGVTGFQEIPGVAGYSADNIELQGLEIDGTYTGITEVSCAFGCCC